MTTRRRGSAYALRDPNSCDRGQLGFRIAEEENEKGEGTYDGKEHKTSKPPKHMGNGNRGGERSGVASQVEGVDIKPRKLPKVDI